MNLAVLAGATIAAGIWLAWAALFPRPEPLHLALARLGRPVDPTPHTTPDLDQRVGSWLAEHRPFSLILPSLERDLELLERTPEQYASTVFTYAVVGLLWAPTVSGGALLLGIPVPWLIPAWTSVAGAGLAAVLPHRRVRQDAAHARAAFVHALSAYCDVAGMAMSAGREVYAALFEAAAAGDGTAFRRIRHALQVGFVVGEKPWVTLQALGESIGIDDLVELGATMALAGDEGAAVRDTVAARARSMRERLVTDAEKQASSATERMAVPGAMLLIGFLWFLAFPALSLIVQQSHDPSPRRPNPCTPSCTRSTSSPSSAHDAEPPPIAGPAPSRP